VNWLKLFVIITLTLIILATIFTALFYYHKSSISSEDKFKILMAGRSTTDMWFRYWNLPSWLNDISIWRDWHIPYKKYVYNDFYFEYLPIPSPKSNLGKQKYKYGKGVYYQISTKLKNENFNALSFKFCFVDFDDTSIKTSQDLDQRLDEMINLVTKLHELCMSKGIKFIIQNALPGFKPSIYGQELRAKLNNWITEYAITNNDVIEIKLYENLIDDEGKLKREFSIEPKDEDSHLNKKAFDVIEKEFLSKLDSL
jgi:hypothetical protein